MGEMHFQGLSARRTLAAPASETAEEARPIANPPSPPPALPVDHRRMDDGQTPLHVPEDVLVVEDSILIALDTEENLRRIGVRSVRIESSVAGALASIERRAPEFGILDFNLGAESCAPVAKELERRGIRFVLATGYAELTDQLEQLGASAMLQKPYGRTEIEQVLTDFF